MKRKSNMNSIIALMAVLLAAPGALADTWFVDDDQVLMYPDANGTSWTNAFKYLQDALSAAQPGDTIKVAQGTYLPDDDDDIPSSTHTAGDQSASFIMKADVTIFGGFRGLPDPLTADDRDIALFETILSGDLLGNDPVRNDNSDSVVNGGVATGPSARLDGFTIRDGDGGFGSLGGAGMFVPTGSSPTIRNCTFTRNSVPGTGFNSGGGLLLDNTSFSRIEDCVFKENEAAEGGGMTIRNMSNPKITRCRFESNVATNRGGGGLGRD